MSQVAMLPSSVFVEQVNIRVEPALKARVEKLKREKKIDMPAELRKVIQAHVEKLEELTR